MSDKRTKRKLPSYVVINDPSCEKRYVLREPAKTVEFPLSSENQKIVAELEEKYDLEGNCAGLAAPQIGYNTRIIVFAVDDDPDLKKHRTDLSDTLSKSIWCNPSYQPIAEEKSVDWESCFSVFDIAAPIARYTEITYEAYTIEGKKITGRAKGFLARVIQHEVDHLNGTLFFDYAPEEERYSKEKLRALRQKRDSESS